MIDTKYKIELDLINHKSNKNMYFSMSDNETSDFYVCIKNNNEYVDLSNYEITLYVEKPNKITKEKKIKYVTEDNTAYCNLETDFKNIKGIYMAQISLKDLVTGEIKFTRDTFDYVVERDIFAKNKGASNNTNKDIYEGSYQVIPKVNEQVLETKEKIMKDNLTVVAIPFFETSNEVGGNTVYIAKEI